MDGFWFYKTVVQILYALSKEAYEQGQPKEAGEPSSLFWDLFDILKVIFTLWLIWHIGVLLLELVAAGAAAEAYTS